jgi:hypothetical protein
MAIRFLNRRFQFSLLTLFVVTTIVAGILGLTPIIRTQLALRSLTNKDVEVMCTDWGYVVNIDSTAANRLVRSGRSSNWILERALADPEKFAAAHALLTAINQPRITLRRGFYNEMQISYDEGRYVFDEEQIPKLQEYWREGLSKKQPLPTDEHID